LWNVSSGPRFDLGLKLSVGSQKKSFSEDNLFQRIQKGSGKKRVGGEVGGGGSEKKKGWVCKMKSFSEDPKRKTKGKRRKKKGIEKKHKRFI
jgi:hypothetical protein